MYTGIVQRMLPIEQLTRKPGLMSFSLKFDDELRAGLEQGASVAINGCCFTVTELSGALVSFDAIQETLDLTNLKHLKVGTQVNIERSAKSDAEVGGHILSGHIVDTARVIDIELTENNRRLTCEANASWLKFVFNKGFLAVNGCSLTVAHLDRDSSTFAINLIPETIVRTNFEQLKVGDELNIEVESQTQVIVETVERVMAERFAQ
ncbi:MAG: riboflavin synthase [Candidatus Azotimanducaceae bacterium]|jgi:riboflavin synthase